MYLYDLLQKKYKNDQLSEMLLILEKYAKEAGDSDLLSIIMSQQAMLKNWERRYKVIGNATEILLERNHIRMVIGENLSQVNQQITVSEAYFPQENLIVDAELKDVYFTRRRAVAGLFISVIVSAFLLFVYKAMWQHDSNSNFLEANNDSGKIMSQHQPGIKKNDGSARAPSENKQVLSQEVLTTYSGLVCDNFKAAGLVEKLLKEKQILCRKVQNVNIDNYFKVILLDVSLVKKGEKVIFNEKILSFDVVLNIKIYNGVKKADCQNYSMNSIVETSDYDNQEQIISQGIDEIFSHINPDILTDFCQ